MLIPFLDRPQQAQRYVVEYTIVSGLVLVGAALAVVSVFGPTANGLLLPVFSLGRIVKLGEFVERVEMVPLGIWTLTAWLKVGLFLWVISVGIGQLFGLRDHRPLIWPLGFLALAFTGGLYKDVFGVIRFFRWQVLGVYSCSVQALLIGLLWAAALIRGKGRGGPDAHGQPRPGRRGAMKLRHAAHRAMALVLTAAMALGAGGCWSRSEIDDLAFITGAGLDLDPATGLVILTVRIVKPDAMAGGVTGGSAPEKVFWTTSYSARTVFEAWRGMLQVSPKRTFAAHQRVLVIGETLARRGMSEVLDFFTRDGEMRQTVHVLVARGTTAQHFLESEYELAEAPDLALETQLRAAAERLSTVAVATLNDLLIAMETPGVEAVAAPAQLLDKPPDEFAGQVERSQITVSPMIGGAGVFRGDRLAGFLEPLEARGLLWATGRVRSGVVVVQDPGTPGKYVSLEIQHAKGRIKPEIKGQDLSIGVDVEVQAALGEVQTRVNPVLWEAYARELEATLAAAIRAEIDTALLRCREWEADAFGFGAAVYRRAPAYWSSVESQWASLFKAVPVRIEVDAKVVRSGLVVRGIAK